MQAWTDGDARAYGACFTPDADYVSYDGTHAAGRAPMVANHDRLFRGVVAGSALVGEVESIRYLRPDVAIVHANGSVLMPWRRKLPRRRFSRQTLVAVRTPQAGGSRPCTTPGSGPRPCPHIHLKGWAKLLRPFLRGYARGQIDRLQLRPVKAAAEAAVEPRDDG